MDEINGARAALEVLRRDGWCKGKWTAPTGEHCISGAAIEAGTSLYQPGPHGDCTSFGHALYDVIDEQFPDRPMSVVGFNDHKDTTFADVELVLEKAALKLDEAVQ